jgi:hypothetical protein
MARLLVVALRQLLVDMYQRTGLLRSPHQAAFQWREYATQLAGTRQVASVPHHLPQALHGSLMARAKIQAGQCPIDGHPRPFHRRQVSEQPGAATQIESDRGTRHDQAR